jgi:hypothetical protein
MNLTVPYMSPGTFTLSPICRSASSILLGVVRSWPVNACSDCFRDAAVAEARRDGDEAVVPNDGRCSPLRGVGVWSAMLLLLMMMLLVLAWSLQESGCQGWVAAREP